MKKIALIFPGIGYHTDKPLLYYSKKLAAAQGFTTIDISYTGFPAGVKGDPAKMEHCFRMALAQTEEILKDEDLKDAQLLILAKSIGTAVAAAYLQKMQLSARCIYYTPVEQTFLFTEPESGIVFTGTADPWVVHESICEKCTENQLPLTIIGNANHSLETGDVQRDLEILQQVMEESKNYIAGISQAEMRKEV